MIRITFVVALATVFLSTDSARANSLNAERLLGMMAALEARVAALETKNREYKRELAAYWTCAALAWSSARLHPAGALLARDYLRLGCTLPVVK